MISTVSMIRLGKVFHNLLVDLRPTNAKLIRRSRQIVRIATGASKEEAIAALAAADGRPKVAIVSILAGVSAERAVALREATHERVRDAVQLAATAENP